MIVKHIAGRRGAALVEFAVSASILAVLLLGMFELGRAIMVRESLTNAAYKGCFRAVTPGTESADVMTDVNKVLIDNGIDATRATLRIYVNDVLADVGTARAGDKISVQVEVPFAAVAWTGAVFLKNALIVSERFVMLHQ